MKLGYSLRFRLVIFYLLIFLVPATIMMTAMPLYFQNSLASETQSLTQGTLTSISRNIGTYLDDLNRLTLSPYLNDDVMQALKLKASPNYARADAYTRLTADRALNTTLPLFLQNSRTDILATVLVASDGTSFIASSGNAISEPVSNFLFDQQDWYQKALRADGNVVFISPHPQDYLQNSSRQVFSVARLIKDPDSGRFLGVIMADADSRVLARIVSDITFNVSSIICILDGENKLLYSSNPLPPAVPAQTFLKPAEINLGDYTYTPIVKEILPAQWNVIVLLSNSEVVAKTRWLYLTGILFAAGGLLATFLLFFILSRWIIRPFREIIGVMKQVETGNLRASIEVKGNDEIAELGRAFNKMVERLNQLIEREYKAVLSQRDAEYRALQSQIRPHFLYNTLNSFIGLNRLKDSAGLENAVYALSSMLHYLQEGEQQVNLEGEIAFVEKYCQLQLLRFRDRLKISIHIDPQLAQLKVPKLFLQPLVENAITHGFEPSGRACKVTIEAGLKIKEESTWANIRVEDDGVGFTSETLDGKACLGLTNVRERLKMAFPGSCFSISSQVGSGTIVEIEIPLSTIFPPGIEGFVNEADLDSKEKVSKTP